MTTRSHIVLGVPLLGLDQVPDVGEAPAAADPSPEAEACRAAFRALIPLGAQLAVRIKNLERLRREYLRTSRRARALEDVLLPELDEALRRVGSALEELEREDVVRARPMARR